MLHNEVEMASKKNVGVTVRSSGVEFRVWAPFAKHVKLFVPFLGVFDGSNIHDMVSEEDGYWSLTVKDAEPGQTYKYQIDTGYEQILRNDPRGRILSETKDGVSVIAPTDFDWGDDMFMPIPKNEQVIYELHIGTFSRKDSGTQGTFYDAIERLDYLQELGVNMIELMPVNSMAYGTGGGYNVNNIYSIEENYGGRHGLMQFVKACHERGIGVIIDVVYNHFMATDLWQFDGWSQDGRGGIYFYNDERADTPWGARPDYGRSEVRQYFIDNIVMWFNEYRVDGLRLDSTVFMRNIRGFDNDPSHDIGDAWSLLQDITDVAHRVRPGSIMIAEDAMSNEYITKHENDGGCGFDSQWWLNFSYAVRQAIGVQAPFEIDFLEQLFGKYENDVFKRVIFGDSHDTAGNGARRLNAAASPDNPESELARKRVLLAGAITLTAPGIPMLLQGQEFLQDGAFNDWEELDWDNAEQFKGVVKAHRHLIDMRLNRHDNSRGLIGQSLAVFHNNPANYIIGYHRWDQGGPRDDVLVLLNLGADTFDEYVITPPHPGTWSIRFDSSWDGYHHDVEITPPGSVTTDEHANLTLRLPAYSVLILSQD